MPAALTTMDARIDPAVPTDGHGVSSIVVAAGAVIRPASIGRRMMAACASFAIVLSLALGLIQGGSFISSVSVRNHHRAASVASLPAHRTVGRASSARHVGQHRSPMPDRQALGAARVASVARFTRAQRLGIHPPSVRAWYSGRGSYDAQAPPTTPLVG